MSLSQHRPRAPAVVCGTAAILFGMSIGARAQLLMPLLGNDGPVLKQADFVLADAAARKLLEPQPAPLGTAANWTDAATGNSGTLTMGRAYRRDGNDCRAVSWHDVFKGGMERTVALDTCRISGLWKLM